MTWQRGRDEVLELLEARSLERVSGAAADGASVLDLGRLTAFQG